MKKITVQEINTVGEIIVGYKTAKPNIKEQPIITQSQDTYKYLRALYSDDSIEHIEAFTIMLLNRRNQVLGWAKISVGGLSGTVVDPKVVFQIALNANASSIILCHNHPSGNLRPSQSDIDLTKKMINAGKILDLPILDHLIITEDKYYSFLDEGMM